jgi:N-acetyl-alpha-D-glucosaminyl L-malate synthase BshA
MRIGIVCYPTFGGSGVVATELGKGLAAKGHEIHFITYDQPARLGSFHANVFYHEVRVSDYPLFDYPPYELVLASKMVEVTRQHKLDLIHAHYAIPHASAAYTARAILEQEGLRVPYITTLHGTDITLLGRDPSFEPVISFAINQSDAVTAVSQSLKEDTRHMFGVNREIEVIPNFFCPSHFAIPIKEDLRAALAPSKEPIITHISNFRPLKRVQDVVQAFARVRAAQPAKLLFIGDGPERHAAEVLAEKLGIHRDTLFLGKVKNPIEALLISDLFMLPSESESFGLSALEAMAAGVPVVASTAGGISEVVEDGVAGILCPIGDVDALAAAALHLLSDPARLERFSIQALHSANRFHIERVLPEYERVYRRVLNY